MKGYKYMRVLIAGGGTAGHINPGIAIAKYLQQQIPTSQVLFVGTERGLEKELVPKEGFDIKLIDVSGFKRKLSLDTLKSIKGLFSGLHDARKIVREFKPDLVIGTGGYVCGPVVLYAALRRIPTLIHEQNAFPGATNKILSRFVDAVAVSFKESEKYFKSAKKICYTGNPLRSSFFTVNKEDARKQLGLDPKEQLLLIFGGSGGSDFLNNIICDMLKACTLKQRIVFATGHKKYEKVKKELASTNLPNLEILPYVYDMNNMMAVADLVVCRAGAITISELEALGTPAILIPSRHVAANHQEYNARALESNKAAVVITEEEITSALLQEKITGLLSNPEKLANLSTNARRLAVKGASQKIFELIKSIT